MMRKHAARLLAVSVVGVAAVAFIVAIIDPAFAQNPFGAPKAAVPDSQVGGIIGWLLVKQSEFYRQISAAIRTAKTDGSAVWTLLGLSFAYGIFHAAGPGHGKAVISSYIVANEETARRGIALSFASALMQALVAIAIVGVGAAILNVTAGQMCRTERVVEVASYGLIAAFGARLAWSKGGGFLRALRDWYRPAPALTPAFAESDAPVVHHHVHNENEHAHHHKHDGRCCGHDHGHAHAPAAIAGAHVHDEHCGCSHGPDPAALAGPGGWARGIGAVLTVGIRPCSGAILVMVFALAQGLFWAGVAATFLMGLGTAITVATIATLVVSAKGAASRLVSASEGGGALALRGIEFGAAALVMLFGLGLLLGYVAAERVTCF
ncbi:nickel/cobalt transporter [[Pseudomonas] carboxydohydrogena]|uniref:Nickel/cobalt efflux system n=2 Tax=Afipia carboxydohydrogena TaxID=290 RepID=A0ABY8BQG9_AFICR|nr:nickel/cobalt transporter [[Pseudomonas] carboxydohydrogena]